MQKIKNLIEKFKQMNRIDKFILSMIIIIFLLVCINLGISINHIKDYAKNKNSGNDRWKQVEGFIMDYKNKVDSIENILQQRNIIINK